MSFAKIESEIIRDADMDGSLKSTPAQDYSNHLWGMVGDLVTQPVWSIDQFSIGLIGRELILLCAKLDLDLTTCIRKAVEK